MYDFVNIINFFCKITSNRFLIRFDFFLALMFLSHCGLLSSMSIHEYCLEWFKKALVPVEYSAYRLLKNNPLSSQVNYLAVPWSVLIRNKALYKIPKVKLNGGFTICQHCHYEKIIPCLRQIGIDVLFTPHATKSKIYDGIKIVPFQFLSINGVAPSEKKDLLYSFVGLDTHKIRKKIFLMKHPVDAIVKQRKRWHFEVPYKQRSRERREFQDLLARSRFSLCPRGVGAGSIRFWESLQAGAIPVLIADDFALPNEVCWGNVIIRVEEKDIESVPKLLKSIDFKTETRLRENCLKVFKMFSENNFVRTIRIYYGELETEI